RYQTHNPEVNAHGHHDFDAVLDGQQRLTAINIGLTGTFAFKKPRVWWEDTEYALPTRKLYLNINEPASEDDDEPGRKYEFKLLPADEFDREPHRWFHVGRILELPGAADLIRMLTKEGYSDNEFAAGALSRLHQVVHIDRIINYYSVGRADMDLALNVFVRVN